MDVRDLDVRLLVTLDALIRHRSVTMAADEIALSQPATSAALARLRKVFDDELLIRVGHSMQLTPRAEDLAAPVAEILQKIRDTLEKPIFDPARADREFVIATADYVTAILFPPLLRRLTIDAPNVTIHAIPLGPDRAHIADTIGPHLWIGPAELAPSGYSHRTILRDRWVCAVWRDHPDVGNRITLNQFLELPHVAFSAMLGEGGSDTFHLERLGVKRTVQATVPDFTVLPFLLQGTRLVALIQERLGKALATRANIKLLKPPVDLPVIEAAMQWHPRFDHDPAHQWLRDSIADAGQETELFSAAKRRRTTART